ncbi:Dehydrogenase (flavoprotein) [Pedococcus dokdonensis]|uniref:Dehydrogenase (Flavoprotein) n=1 Tax=Pedococcus dokdonensis TaxID=443156 RepID=A0A1H0UB26_9MICO|nr:NAD(P)/FAD-dependent oxidoreductase [Pedococcus dokdonensis]SDP63250.1 Dehydrogenase (flavoprotein) [Pedococcus dokdonensis]
MSVDLLVVGGGPVGLATALYAVRRGLTVEVLEPRPGPVDKACGEGLMPGGLTALAELGVHPDGHAVKGIRYLSARGSAVADFRHGLGRGVRRTELHSRLAGAVEHAGVAVHRLSATDLRQDADGVDVATSSPGGTEGPTLRAGHVVAADGLHSWTRRHLGLDHPPDRAARYGLRQHFHLAPWSNHVDVLWAADAEAYVTPVGDDLVGVAVLSRRRRPFAEHLAQFPSLASHLAGAEPATAVQGAGPLRQRSRRRVDGRVLLVGDASGYVDALTGEGISLGLAQARAAVSAVAGGHPRDYERAWLAATWRCSLLTHGLLQATRPQVARRALVPLAARAPWVFSAAVNELGRSA